MQFKKPNISYADVTMKMAHLNMEIKKKQLLGVIKIKNKRR